MAAGRKTGGRVKGVPNKATRDLKAIAQQYTEQAIATLVEIATSGQHEMARVKAAAEILDRAYGRPSQHVEATGDLIVRIVKFGSRDHAAA